MTPSANAGLSDASARSLGPGHAVGASAFVEAAALSPCLGFFYLFVVKPQGKTTVCHKALRSTARGSFCVDGLQRHGARTASISAMRRDDPAGITHSRGQAWLQTSPIGAYRG